MWVPVLSHHATAWPQKIKQSRPPGCIGAGLPGALSLCQGRLCEPQVWPALSQGIRASQRLALSRFIAGHLGTEKRCAQGLQGFWVMELTHLREGRWGWPAPAAVPGPQLLHPARWAPAPVTKSVIVFQSSYLFKYKRTSHFFPVSLKGGPLGRSENSWLGGQRVVRWLSRGAPWNLA